MVEGVSLARDLINTPANDSGRPSSRTPPARSPTRHGASVSRRSSATTCSRENFPLIHAVGRAAARAPRLIDFAWGDPADPKVTLVGKGVCFDTGGLDIKPSSGMLMMKKDMGGAATVLALAHMIMDRAASKVRLRVLIPAVENAISGTAFRPLDVYRARKGLTVEIGNTDAEGRLILADALALADEEAPGPADRHGDADRRRPRRARPRPAAVLHRRRRARRRRSPAMRRAENDPLWRLPLWRPYDTLLDSQDRRPQQRRRRARFAGSITAALFLQALRRRRPRPGCISTSTPGRRRPSPAGRRAANARRRARSMPC